MLKRYREWVNKKKGKIKNRRCQFDCDSSVQCTPQSEKCLDQIKVGHTEFYMIYRNLGKKTNSAGS